MKRSHASVSASVVSVAIATVFTLFGASTGVSARVLASDEISIVPFVRLDGSLSSGSGSSSGAVSTAISSGTLTLQKKGTTQSLIVDAKNLSVAPDGGFGLFIGSSSEVTNGARFVNVLSLLGTNGRWRVTLATNNAAPLQLANLGFTNVSQLDGHFAFIADGSSNHLAVLRTFIPTLVHPPGPPSFSRHANMTLPAAAPSPRGRGVIRVRYNRRLGTSYLEVRVRNLAGGNQYCVYFNPGPGPVPACSNGDNLTGGVGVIRYDTSKGDDLPYGVVTGITNVRQLSGMPVEVRDVFGALHLTGQIPQADYLRLGSCLSDGRSP